jgi:DNA (cytosine-5)-methyltransferase 1
VLQGTGSNGIMGNSSCARLQEHAGDEQDRDKSRRNNEKPSGQSADANFWSDAEWIPCTDGKARPTEPGTFPLAYGTPKGFRQVESRLEELSQVATVDAPSLKEAKWNRSGRIKAYGNAIVAPLAIEFIKAYMEVRGWS